MQQEWIWVGRYIAVIFSAAVLAAALGSMSLFASATVISQKLTAAHIVKFLGYSTGLVVFWLLGQRATAEFARQGGRWGFLSHLLLPVVSLIVAASAHGVLRLVLGQLMDASLRNVYNWTFIMLIIAAAGWLVMAIFNQSSSLTEAFISTTRSLGDSKAANRGPKCNVPVAAGTNYCPVCGEKLVAPAQ